MENNLNLKKYNTPNGIFYCSDTVDKKTVSSFEKFSGNDVEEIKNLRKFINQNSIVFDVGGHIGTFSVPLSVIAKKVYAFEPNPVNIFLFEKNVAENKRDNIELIKKPVTEKAKEVGFVQQPVSGQSYVDESASGIQSVTLDSINVAPDLIKIDIEGFELRALMGAENLLKSKPVLYIEYVLRFLTRAGNTTKELDTFLREHDYATYLHIKGNYFVKLSNLSQIIGKAQTSNLLCIPVNTALPEGLKTVNYFTYLISKVKPIERVGRLLRKI